jgi:hydroxymethylbilane synthase
MPSLIIGSRGSKLALWQANWVKSRIEEFHKGLIVEIEIIKTTGDKFSEASLVRIGGKGVFTKEIEEALLDGRVDLAVHSLKDLPTTLPDGLHIAAITEREDARDALIVREDLRGSVGSIEELPPGARVGTSSLRRAAQLRHARPDLQIIELRGNVETRLRKVDEGDYDAIVLASAGLNRLGFADRITALIDTTEMLTAAGQGALGIEARVADQRTNLLLEPLNHWPTRYATEAERAVLRNLGGGCAVPIAALGRVEKKGKKKRLVLEALVADVEGRSAIRKRIEGPVEQAEELGSELAERLAAAGVRDLLPRLGGGSHPPEGGTTNLPLARRSVILTRATKQSGEIVRALEKLGATIVSCPTIEIREPSSWAALDTALSQLGSYDWLVFTSVNGVEFFLRRLDELGHGRAELMQHLVCAVGRKTAEKLRSESIKVNLTPARFTAEAVVEELIKRYGVGRRLRGARMLLPASASTRDVIRPAMEKIGVIVDVVETYRTVVPAASGENVKELLENARADYIVFTSPSTVSNLAALLETDDLAQHLAGTRVACIGPVTAETAQSHGLTVDIQPQEHTGAAIVRAIVYDCLNAGAEQRA